ncbi:DNA glycosylase AlkZ-like family protein [Isoptericola sediminis]|uniref:Winged helix DNA-binding protein n=1 Tax=Isoptericola sediminis TaxID=2733572 RepID=A0A849K5G2_9MICO|nr:crosslink repair DNA glycosylase YcaQ family protein [Isoptericola sediminis]NNU27269.1 hypothetical protein [Isoptericola sediminis]
MSVDAATVRAARLRSQRLRGPDLPDLPAAVGHLLAVQGQEVRPTLWGLTRRLATSARGNEATALAALDDGQILRTHVLRPTWHLVLPVDVRWLLELTAPRVARTMASTERSWGLDAPGPGVAAVAAEVATGPRTRDELATALVERGVLGADAPGVAVSHILMHAELRKVLISGPAAHGRSTYVAFDDRVPAGYGPLGHRFDRESAVLELWRRWLPARAYATVQDLSQWSGLTRTVLRAGLAVLRDLGEVVEVPGAEDLDGLTLVTTPAVHESVVSGAPAAPSGGRVADLLCAYDELLSSYGETRRVLADPRAPEPGRRNAFVHTVLIDGRRAARWRWPGGPPRPGGPELQWQRAPEAPDRAAVARVTVDLEAFLRAV